MAQTSPMETTDRRLVFEDSIQVTAPLQEVYNRWNDFTHFPEFMSNVEQVRALGGDRYHWAARIFGIKQEWDAEVMDRQPQNRISWKSVNGPYNAGTVSFNGLGNDRTEVRLRLEYAPPGGQIGKTLDTVTQSTKREVHEDLENFRRMMTGESGMSVDRSEQEIAGEGTTRVLGALAFTALGAGIGALSSALVERNMRSIPTSIRSAKAKGIAWGLASRFGVAGPNLPWTERVATPAAVMGWVWTGLSAASVLTSAGLRFGGRKNDGLFVGQWAPTMLGMGLLSRLIGTRDVDPGEPASIVSWAFFGGAIASVLASASIHSRGYRKDGLFVGQWAPTLMIGSVLSRLFNI